MLCCVDRHIYVRRVQGVAARKGSFILWGAFSRGETVQILQGLLSKQNVGSHFVVILVQIEASVNSERSSPAVR